ncbi:signal peptide peptidase SppA [Moraxella catarrhalis]|uniref:Putative peptidase n=1 Tax=Moraxella catarrhalis TaxID=480 RepID=A0A198UFT7_MORCA|nr:signal peptide peptidase SppA [Moraxella catarrhalis]OAU95286.1 putative peptidase [Moraxella catarrhalis]OAU98184.1 putative peptidase [Moraxella catarrhalis]OAU99862.1 putative peptidase [Moraxella catarrhalis]
MAWPPNPDKSPQKISPDTPMSAPRQGEEWRLLEKTLLASIEEQRANRLWSVFLKLLTFAFLVFFIIVLAFGCSGSGSSFERVGIGEPHIAVVDVTGAITANGDTNALNINDSLMEAFENNQAKAVVLNINSPGGSPVQSDEIWQMAMMLRQENPDKKLYAIIGDVGASGAYYIASAADEIWVNPSSLVGSIGVIMSGFNAEELMRKVGIKDRTLTAGEYKDILSVSREMTASEQQHIQNMLDNTHQNFINAVKQGRGDKLINPEQNQLFSGLIWTGTDAVELGLADKTGSISELKRQLELDTVDYTYVNPMNKLFDRFGVQVGKGLGEGLKFSLNQEQTDIK